MKTFLIVVATIIGVGLLIAFRKQIAALLGMDGYANGDPCTDKNGAASTYENGVCKEVVLPGPDDVQQRIIITAPAYVPSSVRVRRGYRGCTETIQLTQYPGYTWSYTGSDYYYCHYRRVA